MQHFDQLDSRIMKTKITFGAKKKKRIRPVKSFQNCPTPFKNTQKPQRKMREREWDENEAPATLIW